MSTLKIHPAATCVPEMSADEYANLKQSIADEGLAVPILLYQGKILDGRHRQRACDETGVEPHYLRDEELLEFGGCPYKAVQVLSERRNLSDNQKAIFAAELIPHFEKEAKARKVESGKATGRGNKKKVVAPRQQPKSGEKAAKATGSSPRSVARAKKILDSGCKQLQQAVKQGRVNLSLAEKVVKELPDLEAQQEVVAVAMMAEKPDKALKAALPKPESEFDPDISGDRLRANLRKLLDAWPEEYLPLAINDVKSVIAEY